MLGCRILGLGFRVQDTGFGIRAYGGRQAG